MPERRKSGAAEPATELMASVDAWALSNAMN